jgi:hypothetical protein
MSCVKFWREVIAKKCKKQPPIDAKAAIENRRRMPAALHVAYLTPSGWD